MTSAKRLKENDEEKNVSEMKNAYLKKIIKVVFFFLKNVISNKLFMPFLARKRFKGKR